LVQAEDDLALTYIIFQCINYPLGYFFTDLLALLISQCEHSVMFTGNSPVHFLFTGRDRKERARCTSCSQGEIETKQSGAFTVHRERQKGNSPLHFLFTGRDRKETAQCTSCSQGEIERNSPVYFLFTGRERKETARCTSCSQGEIERKEPCPVHRER
jgi:hypothetical protein